MPTITFSYKDLCSLVGKKIKIEELTKLLECGKGELEGYDEATDEITVTFGDTNLPYLWSVEGVARLIKGLIGKQLGIPKLEVFKKPGHQIIVDPNIKKIRPYIAAFVAKGHRVDDYLIKQIIDLQEKFCEHYGRRRQKVAIGVYNHKKITFPIVYRATDPESIRFVPLDFRKEMTQKEILEEHPTGKEYAWILEEFKKYPILIDNKDKVLSFPPIINSEFSGKVEMGDQELFFEATGTDLDSVLLAANVFAQAFYDRGFEIFSVDVQYPDEKITTPFLFNEVVRITNSQIRGLIGLDLKETEIKKLLGRMQYGFKNGKVQIPDYRRDIMHPVDIIEDIAIAYGYDRIEMEHMRSYTVGDTFPINGFIDKVREITIGFGYQEVLSAILSNKEVLYDKMNIGDFGTIEIKEFMSERYSVVRTWILPILMEVLAVNKHAEYPQRIFEEGLVTVRKGEGIADYHRLALVSAHKDANYTEARQALDSIMSSFGARYEIEEAEHGSFIPGRVGRVIVNGKKVAFIGEIAPEVLKRFDLTVPVVGFELNLSELFEAVK